MARDDIKTMLTGIIALTATTNAALSAGQVNGEIIDLQGETGGAFLVSIPAITGGALAVGIEHGDDPTLSDAAAVTDPYHIDGLIEVGEAGTYGLGYYGIKRYIRLTTTPVGTVTGASAFATYASCKQDRGALS